MRTRSNRQKVLALIAQHRAVTAEQILAKIPTLTHDTLKNITDSLICDRLIRPLKEDSWIIAV